MSVRGPFERTLDAMSHQYRRQLLLTLVECLPEESLDGYVPSHYNYDSERPNPAEEEAQHLGVDGGTAVESYHRHLPKLANYGYIRWEKSTGEVARGRDWEEIEPLLTLLWSHRHELPAEWL